jgi:hypothetical protein
MSSSSRTTVYLDSESYVRIKAIARTEGRTAAALVREAVVKYAATRAGQPKPRCVGIGKSGRHDLSSRADKLLEGMGRRR